MDWVNFCCGFSLILLFIYSLIKSDPDASPLGSTNAILLLIFIVIIVCYWTIKKFLHMVNSVSRGVIETNNLMRQASEENVLNPSDNVSNARYEGTSTGASMVSVNGSSFQFGELNAAALRAESENVIDMRSNRSANNSLLGTPQPKSKAATLEPNNNNNHNDDVDRLIAPAMSAKKEKKTRKKQLKPSDFQLKPIAESQKYLPPIYHLMKRPDFEHKLKDPFKPKPKSWFSQGPDKNLLGSMRVSTTRQQPTFRKHRRSASEGNNLEVLLRMKKDKGSEKDKPTLKKDFTPRTSRLGGTSGPEGRRVSGAEGGSAGDFAV